jgi:UDP-galactopyranose mutase
MSDRKYDYVIVGSGLFGCVFAEQARLAGKTCIVIERRNHIGGNCYSYEFEDTGINVHAYGTHIFHTNDRGIWNYVNRFTQFNHYQHRVLTTFDGKVYTMPINLGTINSFYDVSLRPFEVSEFLDAKKGVIERPRNLEEKAISLIGLDLYEAFIKGYTKKQWGCDPKELPASIITRLPVRESYNDLYFNDRYQGIPVGGYTPIFEGLLDDTPVELGTDYFDDPEYWRGLGKKLVYTGPIDRFFDYSYGHLNWRSVRFEMEKKAVADYQGTSVMNYADESIPYTRIHEPKHLHPERTLNRAETVIIREYSHVDPDEPYYPVNFAEDKAKLDKYAAMQKGETRVIFGGRLASYKYYDMHQVIGQALAVSKRELQK